MKRAIAILALALATTLVAGDAAALPRESHRLLAFVAAENDAVLVVVDVERRKVLRRISVPPGPHNVTASADGEAILVTSPPSGEVTQVSPSSLQTAHRFRGLVYPHDVKAAGRFAFVAEERASRIAVLDLKRRRLVARLAIGARPHDLALSRDGRWLWVTENSRDAGITVVDVRRPTQPQVTARLSAVASPHDIVFAPRAPRVWVTRWAASDVVAVDTRSRRHVFSVEIGGEPHHFAFEPGGRAVWVTDNAGGAIAVISARSGRVLRRLRAGPSPHHVAILDGRAIVAVHGEGALAVYALGGRRLGAVRVGSGPHGVALVRS